MSRQQLGARPALPGAFPLGQRAETSVRHAAPAYWSQSRSTPSSGPALWRAVPRLAATALGLVLTGAAPALVQAQPAGRQPPRPEPAAASTPTPAPGDNRIVAVVNGEVVSRADVVNRARLFALNTGLNLPPEMLDRLGAQLTRLLVDERLRLQEVQRRRIPVSDRDVAEAVQDVESRNNLPPGGLRQQLAAVGIQPRVMFDQIRTQIGWARLLRLQLGAEAQPSDAVVEEAMRAARARVGQPEYLVSEIFVPLDDPRQEGETRRFVEEVIGQLRRGVPFPVVATQFSQAHGYGARRWRRR